MMKLNGEQKKSTTRRQEQPVHVQPEVGHERHTYKTSDGWRPSGCPTDKLTVHTRAGTDTPAAARLLVVCFPYKHSVLVRDCHASADLIAKRERGARKLDTAAANDSVR